MEKIRIIAPPALDAPEEILSDFVGIEIEVNSPALNRLLLDDPTVWNRTVSGIGRVVLTKDVIASLEAVGKHATADYCRNQRVKVMKFVEGTYEVVNE